VNKQTYIAVWVVHNLVIIFMLLFEGTQGLSTYNIWYFMGLSYVYEEEI